MEGDSLFIMLFLCVPSLSQLVSRGAMIARVSAPSLRSHTRALSGIVSHRNTAILGYAYVKLKCSRKSV